MSEYKVSGIPIVDSDGDIFARSITTDTVNFIYLGIGGSATKAYTYAGLRFPGQPGHFLYDRTDIESFPFASESPIGQHLDTGSYARNAAGTASTDNGYFTGGKVFYPPNSYYSKSNAVKMPFASASSSAIPQVMTAGRQHHAAHQSLTHGYNSGGFSQSPNPSFATYHDTIDRFTFANETNSYASVGNLANSKKGLHSTGQSSASHGYIFGGVPNFGIPNPTSTENFIQKFPFATDTNASDVGDMSTARWSCAGQSSASNGYATGGFNQPGQNGNAYETMDKFPFSNDTNATDIGNLTQHRIRPGGASSRTKGYSVGGAERGNPPYLYQSQVTVDGFPFSSDGNSTDVGDLALARSYNGTTQG